MVMALSGHADGLGLTGAGKTRRPESAIIVRIHRAERRREVASQNELRPIKPAPPTSEYLRNLRRVAFMAAEYQKRALIAITGNRTDPLLDCSDVQASDRDACVLIKPNHDPAALWIQTGVISTGDAVPPAAACNNGKRFEWAGFQVLTNIANHRDHTATISPV